MGPNDAELVRVFTRATGSPISDVTHPANAGFQVVVDAEAGNALHAATTGYTVGVIVRDLADLSLIPATEAVTGTNPLAGAMTDASWPAPANQFVFNVALAAIAGKANRPCEVMAWLRTAGGDVSFATGPRFMITP
jgi:hypothetical protein